jgi:hypothetical protein
MIVEGLMHHHKLGSLGMVYQLLNKRSPNPFTIHYLTIMKKNTLQYFQAAACLSTHIAGKGFSRALEPDL